MFITSPGPDILIEAEFVSPEKIRSLGLAKSETLPIGSRFRTTCDHKEAQTFYNRFPQARIYLKLFKNYSFTSTDCLTSIQTMVHSKTYKDKIFLLESGALAGQYDYFILVIAADEQAYLDFMTSKSGLYGLNGTHVTDSITLSVTPQEIKPLFTEGHFNLSKP